MDHTSKPLDPGLAALVGHFGSRGKIAAALNISRAAVSQWRRVPAARAIELSRMTGIPIERIRPEANGASA